MKRNRIPFAIAIFVSMVFVHCQSNEVSESADVNQDKIYQQYKVYYNEKERKASVEATFRFDGRNGNTLHLNEPSKVTINDKMLKEGKKFMGGQEYNGTVKIGGSDSPVLTINFYDTNNKKDKNDIWLKPSGGIIVPQSVKKGENFTIKWKYALAENDDMTINFIENSSISIPNLEDTLINTTVTDSKLNFTLYPEVGKNSITVDASSFNDLKNDTVFVKIDKDKTINLQQQTQASGIIYYYHTVYDGMIIFK